MSPHNDPNLPLGDVRNEDELHPESTNPEVNFDRTDMSARAIIGFLIFLAIAGVIMHLVLWGLYKNFAGSYKASMKVAAPIATSNRQMPQQGNPERTFPAPRLQADPVADMNKLRVQEEQTLNSYGWVDQNAGVVRIPIEKAIQLLAKQGLPTRPAPANDAETEMMRAPATGSGGAVTRQQASPSATAKTQ